MTRVAGRSVALRKLWLVTREFLPVVGVDNGRERWQENKSNSIFDCVVDKGVIAARQEAVGVNSFLQDADNPVLRLIKCISWFRFIS